MPQMILYLDEKENKIIERIAKQRGLSKAETVKAMIKEHTE